MKKHEPTFKAEAIRLALTSSQPISKTARDLGLKESTLYNWLSQERNKTGKQVNNPEDEVNLVDELNRLRKENMRLREEREILKKATAFFAKEQK